MVINIKWLDIGNVFINLLAKTKLTKAFCLVATKLLCLPSNFNQLHNISNPKYVFLSKSVVEF